MRRCLLVCVFLTTLFLSAVAYASQGEGKVLVLCYHAVQKSPAPGDLYTISQRRFAEQMEYLRTHGYTPVSLDDIINASKGGKKLPDKPVLLTFDDGYISYYEFVMPFLERLGYPSVLAVVGTFPDSPPKGLPEKIMSWGQIREAAGKDLVEVISHTYDMHKGLIYTPHGDEGQAARVLAYNKASKSYETPGEYVARLDKDFRKQKEIFRAKLGFAPRALAWPYGKFTRPGLEAASRAGYQVTFTLEEGYAELSRPMAMNRKIIYNEPMKEFIKMLKDPSEEKYPIRAVQVDLDLVYDPGSPERTRANLDRLMDRLVDMKVNTVFLQAFADPEGTGDVESVYFKNSVLPVREDIFGHVAHQMIIREIAVYAWMPTLAVVLPGKRGARLRVMESNGREKRPSKSWYKRLTPFSVEARKTVRALYEDLASHTIIDGVLFQDDAYLAEDEDFHPEALKAYRERFGEDLDPAAIGGDEGLKWRWARFKTEALVEFTKEMMEGVRKYRPTVRFARNLYAPVIMEPVSQLWFAQDYSLFLEAYDQVVVMAYPRMEEVDDPIGWLGEMAARVKKEGGVEKTVFKLQAFDWAADGWIDSESLLEQMREILSSGGRHIAYYPDDFTTDNPRLGRIKLEMSTKSYPFIP